MGLSSPALAHGPQPPAPHAHPASHPGLDPAQQYEAALHRRDAALDRLVHWIAGVSHRLLFAKGGHDDLELTGEQLVQAVQERLAPRVRQLLERQRAFEANLGVDEPAPAPLPGPGGVVNPPEVDDSDHPCDMPDPGFPAFMDCSIGQVSYLAEAWDRAFYETWRARQYLQAIQDKPELWWTGWDGEHAVEKWQVANWFGDGSAAEVAERRDEILASYDDIWDKYLTAGGDLTLRCYQPPKWWEVIFAPWEILYGAPCWSGAAAHHWSEGTVVVCDSFYNAEFPVNRGRTLIHEMLHHTWNAFGLIRDTHVGKHCGANSKCYGTDDSLHVAEDHPKDAATNNDNYAWFAEIYGASYLHPGPLSDEPDAPLISACNLVGVCFETDMSAPGCQPPPPGTDPYPGCSDPSDPSLFGTPGCPCDDVSIIKFEDTANEGGFPDGSGSYLAHGLTFGPGQYCESSTGGADAVCGTTVADGKAFPVCQVCGVDTMLGCGCDSNSACGGFEATDGPLRCWGLGADGWGGGTLQPGTCLPDDGSPAGRERVSEMPWMCVDNCEALAPGQDWPMACVFDQTSWEFDHGECVDLLGCDGLLPGECEASGRRCDQETDTCVDECVVSADCAQWGFPPHYECNAQFGAPGRCVPLACANPKSAEFGGPYCALFE